MCVYMYTFLNSLFPQTCPSKTHLHPGLSSVRPLPALILMISIAHRSTSQSRGEDCRPQLQNTQGGGIPWKVHERRMQRMVASSFLALQLLSVVTVQLWCQLGDSSRKIGVKVL